MPSRKSARKVPAQAAAKKQRLPMAKKGKATQPAPKKADAPREEADDGKIPFDLETMLAPFENRDTPESAAMLTKALKCRYTPEQGAIVYKALVERGLIIKGGQYRVVFFVMWCHPVSCTRKPSPLLAFS